MLSVVGLLLGVISLGGCEAVDTAREVVKQKGAKIADGILTDAEWVLCKEASIGSIKRRYGKTVESANTYKDFCDGDGRANVVSPK